MSLVTLEVEIDHGRVIARGPEFLPDRAMELLTLLPRTSDAPARPVSISSFVERWAGAFSLPSQDASSDDPRLAYLLKKHAK